MGSSFGNIGDSFPDTEVKCRVHGCKNIVRISGREAMANIAKGKSRPERMCDKCYARLQTLEDKEMPCSKPGCHGTWIWNRFQQLEAAASGRDNSRIRGFCHECQEEIKASQSKNIPCRMKGCKNTWTLSPREQMELGSKPVPHKLCDDCFKLLGTLADKELKCRINGCENTWNWNRFQQLEHIRAGKSIDNPPAKMCDSCFNIFKKLTPKEEPCRIKGCKNTWSYTPYEQLERILKHKAETTEENTEVPAPAKMCKDCFAVFSAAQDIQLPCRNKNCKNTWLYTRNMQVTAKVRGKTQPPSHYCQECAKQLESLQEKQMPCAVKGCTGTWLYSKDEQLRDNSAGRQPQMKKCKDCSDFLNSHPSINVNCGKCGCPVEVSNVLQLNVKLGVSTMPSLCADCAGQALTQELEQGAHPISRPVIYIPKSGPWLEEEAIRNWPSLMTKDKIAAMAKAGCRIVCLGDDMVLSCPDNNEDWPARLEKLLAEKCGDSIAVLNSGITGSTTEMLLKRFNRDVIPFKPQVVIVSSVFADAMALATLTAEEEQAAFLAKLGECTVTLIEKLGEINAKPVFLIPNMIYPEESPQAKIDPEKANRIQQAFDLVLRCSRRFWEAAPTVDARALFAVAGEKNSRSCMADWFLHNAAGANNIANWLKDEINSAALFDGADITPLETQGNSLA